MKIFCKFPTINFWLVICITKNFMDNFKGDFLNILIFSHLQIPDFQIVESQPNIIQQMYKDV